MKILIGVILIIGAIFCFYIAHSFEDEWSEKILEYLGAFALLLFIIGGLGVWNGTTSLLSRNNQSTSQQKATGGYEQLGHKINKTGVKEEKDGAYYADKSDSKARYFTNNDNEITAIKYNYMPDPMSTSSVQGKLEELLNDKNLKYGNDKISRNDTTLDNDDYNVYSPKYKKWYHISMQKDDKGEVSTFSVWPGKVSDAE